MIVMFWGWKVGGCEVLGPIYSIQYQYTAYVLMNAVTKFHLIYFIAAFLIRNYCI